MQSPRLYATFLLWLLSELFEVLPEVGDLDKPKFVFFFDEAHLLFDDAPKALLDKIEQVVRLIRSKGVGVYFITQNPLDIPESVLGQLGNRVQHALRAFTPRDQKAVKTAAETFRPNKKFNAATAIIELGVGEALVSFLDAKGVPEPVERCFIAPPRGRIGPATDAERAAVDEGKSARRQVRTHGRSRIGLRGADRTRDRRPGAHDDAAADREPQSTRPVRCAATGRRAVVAGPWGRSRDPADRTRPSRPSRSPACARPSRRRRTARCPRRRRAAQRFDRHDDRQDRGAHGDQRRWCARRKAILAACMKNGGSQILRGVLGRC